MRSGREHLAWILAVEVRQGTLGVDGRGWGPAGHTGRGWSWLKSGREQEERRRGEETKRGEEKRGEEEEEDEKREEKEEDEEDEEEATDIKSNNPHLAGGEKTHLPFINITPILEIPVVDPFLSRSVA